MRIAGAGPSGLSCAITLARAGRSVEIFESKAAVGARFIGDLQIIENYSDKETVPDLLARIGIEPSFYFRPIDYSTFYDHKGKAQRVRSERPYGYFIRRGPFEGTLDTGLLAQARALGVEVHFEKRIDAADADVVATGPATPDGLAKEITFRTDDPETVDVFFNHHFSPGGYSYLFILDGVATFGCAIVSDFKQIEAYFDRSLARAQRIRPFAVGSELRTGYSYMNFHLKNTATDGDRRYVGEAAGFQDYLFGLGIRYALTSGHLAARSILENRDFDELWKGGLGRKQETSVVNRFLYEVGGNFGLSIFTKDAARAKDLKDYLAAWHEDRWWKRALRPIIQKLWTNRNRCTHKPGDHWCRSRDSAIKVPPLGPAD